MSAISRALRRTALGIAGALTISVVVLGCGESRPVGRDAGRPGTGGAAGNTGTGGVSGSGGQAGGSGGLRFDGGLPDINLDALRFDLGPIDLGPIDVSIPACPANVKTGDACGAGDQGCREGGTICLCFNMKWNCFSSGSDR